MDGDGFALLLSAGGVGLVILAALTGGMAWVKWRNRD